MYINAHAHYQGEKAGAISVVVGKHTFGIHPWDMHAELTYDSFDNIWQECLFKKMVVFAIGECGLDRARSNIASIDIQKYALIKHLELAHESNLPVVIHCVKAFSDLLEILKKTQFKNSILIHDYSGNKEEMRELLKYKTFFSYGKRIFNNDSMLKITPLDRILFETDDDKNLQIEQVYKKGSLSLGVLEDELEKIIENNFLNYFGQLQNLRLSSFVSNFN